MTHKIGALHRAVRLHRERPVFILLLAGLSSPAISQNNASTVDDADTVGITSEVDVIAGINVVSNPYNSSKSADTSGAVIAATLEVRPTFRLIDGTDSFELQGLVQLRQFTERFGLEDSYGANARMVSRRSDRFTIRANGNFAYDESGFNNGLRSQLPFGISDPVAPINPLPGTGAPFDDVTIIGQRTRIKSIGSSLGFDYRLTDRSIIAADVSGRALRFGSGEFGDYNQITEELRYSRILTDRTTVGAIVQLSQVDYRGVRLGDANSISGLLSVDHRFDERLKGSLSAGIAVTEIRQELGLPNRTLESFTLRGQLCRGGERTNFCLNAQRSPQPSASGSVRTSQTLGFDYWQRISPREQVSLSANYAHTSRSRVAVTNEGSVEFVNASASYENTIRKNTAAFASVNFSKIYEDGGARPASYGATVGIRFKFGASR